MDIHKAIAVFNKRLASEKKRLAKPLMAEIEKTEKRLHHLRDTLAELTGVVSSNGTMKATKPVIHRAGGKRKKRTSSQALNKKALEVVNYIESRGKATASEILERFGKLTPSISAFLKGRTDRKVKHTGPKNKRVYTVA